MNTDSVIHVLAENWKQFFKWTKQGNVDTYKCRYIHDKHQLLHLENIVIYGIGDFEKRYNYKELITVINKLNNVEIIKI